MCLVENAQHTKKYLNTYKSGFALIKPCVNCFVHRYCFVFENYIVFSKSLFEILEKFFECLETRNANLETRLSILDSRFSKTSRIENRVSSRDCQLTFERYCIERSRENSFWANRGKHHLNLHLDLPVFSRDFTLYCDDANVGAHDNSCLYRALKIEDQLILSSHAESIFLRAKSNRVSSRAKSSPGGDIQVIEERRVSSQLCNRYKNHQEAETDGNHGQGQEYRKAQKVKRRSQNLHRRSDAEGRWNNERSNPEEAGKTWYHSASINSAKIQKAARMDSSTYQILSADLRCKQSQAIRVRSASFRDRRYFRQRHFYWRMLDLPGTVPPYLL